MLECNNIGKSFGGVVALESVSLKTEKGSVFGIIGPNGSGKSTLIDIISGFLKPDRGQVLLSGMKITRMAPSKISRLGLARTFQITKSFIGMTLIENLIVAYPDGVCREASELAVSILSRLKLDRLQDEKAISLSYGQQKLLGIGRLMMRNPNTILLDEPFAGINPVVQEEIVSLLTKLRESVAIVLVEHDMKMITRVCDRIIALDRGKIIAEGVPSEVLKDRKVVDAYLGG
ncbi:MAG: ABC transporter ATP-binding protein [Nitrososphaerales archaeon]